MLQDRIKQYILQYGIKNKDIVEQMGMLESKVSRFMHNEYALKADEAGEFIRIFVKSKQDKYWIVTGERLGLEPEENKMQSILKEMNEDLRALKEEIRALKRP